MRKTTVDFPSPVVFFDIDGAPETPVPHLNGLSEMGLQIMAQ